MFDRPDTFALITKEAWRVLLALQLVVACVRQGRDDWQEWSAVAVTEHQNIANLSGGLHFPVGGQPLHCIGRQRDRAQQRCSAGHCHSTLAITPEIMLKCADAAVNHPLASGKHSIASQGPSVTKCKCHVLCSIQATFQVYLSVHASGSYHDGGPLDSLVLPSAAHVHHACSVGQADKHNNGQRRRGCRQGDG